jgi:hypothetical protein
MVLREAAARDGTQSAVIVGDLSRQPPSVTFRGIGKSRDWTYWHFVSVNSGVANEPFALWIGARWPRIERVWDDPTIEAQVAHTRHELGLRKYVRVSVANRRPCGADSRIMHEPLASEGNVSQIRRYACVAAKVMVTFEALSPSVKPYADAVLSMLKSAGVSYLRI